MKFSDLDSRKAADKPMPLHLLSPANGVELIDNGEPVRVLVYGIEGKIGQEVSEEITAANSIKKPEARYAAQIKAVARLIAGFENLELDDGEPATVADAERFLRLQLSGADPRYPSFADQVLAFARSRANFLGNV